MATRILARELDDLVATLADLGDYLRDDLRLPGTEADRRELETFAGDALLAAVQARRTVAPLTPLTPIGKLEELR